MERETGTGFADHRNALRRAYTLVEILIGVFILSIGIVSILGAFPLGMRIVARIKRTTLLCTFAASKMAEYQAYANPMGTLCAGENAAATTVGGIEVNPYVDITPDTIHTVPGIEGNRSSGYVYSVNNTAPNGSAGPAALGVPGGGKSLRWKISDFDVYIRSAVYRTREGGVKEVYLGVSNYTPSGDDFYNNILNVTYTMGLVQNERRYENAYGFTRIYVIEAFDGPEVAKTDKDYDPVNPPRYNAYYCFSTAVWNPHVFHSTEWSPVKQSAAPYGSVYIQGEGTKGKNQVDHDYFWTWHNELEGWGFVPGRKNIKDDSVIDGTTIAPPAAPMKAPFPWL